MEIRRAMEEFLTALKESSSYKDYHYQKERVKRVPGLAERINDFRAKRFEFQNYQGDDLFEKIDEFEKQYEIFQEEPMVREYLDGIQGYILIIIMVFTKSILINLDKHTSN